MHYTTQNELQANLNLEPVPPLDTFKNLLKLSEKCNWKKKGWIK